MSGFVTMFAQFFGWHCQPFADAHLRPSPFLSARNKAFLRLAADLGVEIL